MSKIIDRIGEKRMMNCGLEATITRYGSNKDIDVQFEDGQVVYHRDYPSFKKGTISPPIDPRKIDRTGEKRMMNCGLEATIIRYGSCMDIDVQFEDGQVVYHRKYNNFKKGRIAPPNYTRLIDRTDEKRMMKCGLEATIIRYGSSRDIDVQFEDGQVVYHRDYSSFQKGKIAPPIDPRKIDHTGEKRMMKCGLFAEITRWGGWQDVDIRFEDGQEVYHRQYQNFLASKTQPPIDPQTKAHIGEKRKMNCGLVAEITNLRNSHDIDVRFEDGQTITNRSYSEFIVGEIAPPVDPRYSHLGEEKMMNCGLVAKITVYRCFDDIDVCFEDKQEVYHRSYGDYKKGTIAPPNNPRMPSHIGEKRKMSCGLIAEIINWRNKHDIDVRFEDGTVYKHKAYSESFKKGKIAHPSFFPNYTRTTQYGTLRIRYRAISPESGEPYYYCKCQKCSFEIIDTARNIIKLEHKCETQPTEEGEN